MKSHSKSLAITIILALGVTARVGTAAEEHYEYPTIAPIARLGGGFNYVDNSDSTKAGEFDYLDSSVVVEGLYKSFPFPHRLHLEADVANKNDYFGDFRYSYEDLFLSRLMLRRLFHNLDNLTLQDFGPAASSPDIDRRDIGRDYGIRTDIDQYFLRFKTPDFPFHIYTNGEIITRKGDRQQRFLGGAAFFNDLERVTADRSVDQQSRQYTIGANSHLGPVEVDLAHAGRTFEPSGQSLLFEDYGAAGFPAGTTRTAGEFPHNGLPEIRTATNSLKIHTTLTGRLVGSATATTIDKRNDASGAAIDIAMGHGEITYIPQANLILAAKFNHTKKDADTPGTVTVADRLNPANSFTYTTKPAISSTTDTATALLRYRPFAKLTLKGQYQKQRKEIEDQGDQRWHLANETINDTWEAGFSWRALREVKVAGRFIYTDTRQQTATPFINFEPETSRQGILSVTWLPLPWLTALLNCNISKDSTDNLRILDTAGLFVDNVHNAELLNQRLLGSVTMQLTDRLSLTESYAYMSSETERDLVYDAFLPAQPFVDQGYTNKIKAHNLALNLMYVPTARLTLEALLDYTAGNGMYYPTTPEALTPASIGLFSNTATEEITVGLDGRYELGNGWSAGLGLRHINWDDDSFDSPNDGKYYSTILKALKKW